MSPSTGSIDASFPVVGVGSSQGGGRLEGRDEFLKLLVAQMRYQDPLNPLSGTDFTAQLAQFSSLDELRNISQRLQESIETDLLMARAVNNTMAASLIGKRVRAMVDFVHFDGKNETSLVVNVPQSVSSLTVEILTDTGQILKTFQSYNLSPGDHRFSWNGRDNRGNVVPPGNYTLRVKATGMNGEGVSALPIFEGVIGGVRFIEGNPVLICGDQAIPFGSVLEISEDRGGEGLITRVLRSVGIGQ